MAFTLQVRSEGKKLDFQELLARCRLACGMSNAYYILEEPSQPVEKDFAGTTILYRPTRMGRGIYFDAREASKGYVEISYNKIGRAHV